MPSYFITGCRRGLGLEFVRQLADQPSNVVIATTRTTSSELEKLQADNKNVHVLTTDVSDLSKMSSLSSQISTILGGDGKLDYLLNNAGVNINNPQSIMDLSPEDLQQSIIVNVQTPAEIVKALQPLLHPGSVIMNMTSGVSSMTHMKSKVFSVGAPYAISKAAVNMMTVMQSNALKEKGIIVFCMDPGHVKTDMGGDEAPLYPEESIKGMLKILDGMKEQDTGKFFQYDGAEVPW